MNRQLTAIMFADMVGYTALMQEDEGQAKAARDRNRHTLVKEVESHGGRILQFYGDGTLSVFQSAIQGVQCAIAIQTELQTPPSVPVRIGLHTGDIVYDDDGVFGDGVNLAARVQGLAPPGGVLLSEKVYDEVKNQPEIQTRSMGPFALKNVKRPMELWAVANNGIVVPDPGSMSGRPSDPGQSVAVLPFMNMSSDPENEFFSDGITEELINVLTRVNGLQVTARTSSFAFKGENRDIREIGEKLGVATVLEGSVRRSGDRVRITAQLIDASNGYHLFSKSYDRELLNIFETQDELAQTIVEELRDRLEEEEAPPTEEEPAETMDAEVEGEPAVDHHPHAHFHDTEAYTEHLKGVHSYKKWTPEGARGAVRHFQESIRMDPQCALPYSGMASAYTFLAALGQMPPQDAYARAREAAEKALELEDDRAEPHAAMAVVLLFHDWDFQGAYRHFQKALTLTPGAAPLRQHYAMYLLAVGEVEAAEEEMETAVQLDPLSSPIRAGLGQALLHGRKFKEAESQFRRVLELDPEFRTARELLGWTLLVQGHPEEALREFEEINRRTGDPFKVIPHRGYALAKLGREEEARQLLLLLEERREREPEVALQMDFAMIHLGLGDVERALDYLEEAVEARLGSAIFMGSHVGFDSIRSHPRFRRLLDTVGVREPGLRLRP
jgi:TolB-like protein/Tfp pilus assembly protein PilF